MTDRYKAELDAQRALSDQFTPQVPAWPHLRPDPPGSSFDEAMRRLYTGLKGKLTNTRDHPASRGERVRQQLTALGTGVTDPFLKPEYRSGGIGDPGLASIKQRLAERNRAVLRGDELGPEQMAMKQRLQSRNQQILQAGTEKFQEQQVAQQLAAQGAKVQKKETINPDGSTDTQTDINQPDGTSISVKQKGQAAQPGAPEAQQVSATTADMGGFNFDGAMLPPQSTYEKLLMRRAEGREPGLNLHPLAQLVDTWTGSRIAPGMQDAEARERVRWADRVAAAKGLYDLRAGEAAAAAKAKLDAAKIKKLEADARKADKDKDKFIDIESKFNRDMEKNIIAGDKLQKALVDYPELVGIAPASYKQALEGVRNLMETSNINPFIRSMAMEEVRDRRAKGDRWEVITGGRDRLMNKVRAIEKKIIQEAERKRKAGELTAFERQANR